MKQSVFFQILEVLDVNLPLNDRTRLIRVLEKNDKVNYVDGIRMLYLQPHSL